MKRKLGTTVLVLLLVSVLLYGCGSEQPDTQTAQTETATAAQETAAAVEETTTEPAQTAKKEKETTEPASQTTEQTTKSTQPSTRAAQKKTETRETKEKKQTQKKKSAKNEKKKETTASKKAIAQKYVGKDVSSLIAAVGSPTSRSYANSCLGSGEDGELRYNGFTVYTYRENGKETVQHVE